MTTSDREKLASQKLTHLLLSHYNSHPSLSPTFLLSGPLLSTSRLSHTQLPPPPSQTTATQSLAHLAGKGGLRIVDMDEMSDGERNSEDGDAEDDGIIGNDNGLEGFVEDVRVHVEGDDDVDEVLKSEEVAKWGVVLVGLEKLEEKKRLFEKETLNVHIYSLSPAVIQDPAMYLVPAITLRSHQAYFDQKTYGTITGDAFAPPKMKDGGMGWGKKQDIVVKEKEPAKKDNIVGTKKEPESEEMVLKSKKPSPPPPKASSSKPPTKTRKNVIHSSDEDEPDSLAKPALEPTSSMVREEDKAAMEAIMGMDIEMDDMEEKVRVKKEPGAKRKRRQVKTRVMTTDAKGYTVTKDEWREESYSGESEDESQKTATSDKTNKPIKGRPSLGGTSRLSTASIDSTTDEKKKPAGKPLPKPAPQAKKTVAGGQSTLKGFFKKA
ncbi:DNA polymerase delta subunit 3, partial [Tremellales sp. Uapishka_1]